MDTRDHMESYMVALFPFWPVGMAVAKFDVLEKTTNEAKRIQHGYPGHALTAVHIIFDL